MRPAKSFIEQPVRSLQTMLRVIALDDPRIPLLTPDGIFGISTMQSVTAFQRLHTIPITGIVDQLTWETIVHVYESALTRVDKAEPIEIIMDSKQVFRLGDQSPYILLLQSILTQLSHDASSITPPGHSGILDQETSNALSAFQKLAGLPPTGELDKITWKHISRQFTLSAHNETIKQT